MSAGSMGVMSLPSLPCTHDSLMIALEAIIEIFIFHASALILINLKGNLFLVLYFIIYCPLENSTEIGKISWIIEARVTIYN